MSSTEAPATRPPPLAIGGLSEIGDRYAAAIVDMWGVLHDGVTAFPAALDCLERLRAAGKRVAILSNAPRRAEAVAARNRELGIEARHFDVLHSSGEATWRHLKERDDSWYAALGRACYHLGPERDWGLREGLGLDVVEDVEAADFLLNTGAYEPEDRPEDFDPVLRPARSRDLPMVCANPDLVVVRGGKREICAGAIAQRYEALGGLVRYHGKPHPDVFETCLAHLGATRREVLVIGDSLGTDIAGAAAAGLDSLLVTGGIHADALGVAPEAVAPPARLTVLCADFGQWPDTTLPVLRW